jgi:uncharacterized repeat protein (TIGR03806 family)
MLVQSFRARRRRLSLAGGALLALSLSVFSMVHAQGTGGPALDRQPFGGANRGLFSGGMGGPAGAPMLRRAFANVRVQQPTAIGAVPGTNQMYVVQQAGRVITFENRDDATASTTMLDIATRIGQGGANERGLLNLAFDKDFATNGFFYVYYTGGQGQNTNFPAFLDRYQATSRDPLMAPASTRCQILTVTQPQSNHNGVGMFVDKDGFLYVSFGDGGGANDRGAGHAPEGNGQNLNTLLGKLIRIKVNTTPGNCTYSTAGNPFSNAAGTAPTRSGVPREIFAIGLRHPYRMTQDRQTGDVWIGDVGQNAREEVDFMSRAQIDRVLAGGGAPNFGWPCREGAIAGPIVTASCDAANERIDPVFDYVEGNNASVIGGFLYRGNALPQLKGKYIYARYGMQQLNMVTPNPAGGRATSEMMLFSTATLGGRIWSIGEDADGELYAVFGAANQISKLVPTGAATDAGTVPARLSQTGLFSDTRALTLARGVVPYDVNAKLFSENLEKVRAFAIPDGSKISFDAKGRFDMPVGSVVLKHFEEADGKRIETRILARTADIWRSFTYEWLADQSDAMLVPETGKTIRLSNGQMYDLPSSADCQACHNRGMSDTPKQIIGLQARQMNFEMLYERDPNTGGKGMRANQLQALNQAGFFNTDIGDPARLGLFPKNPPENLANLSNADVNLAARSFMESNCAICHRPGGGTPTPIDLQFDTANAATMIFNEPPGEGFVDGAMLTVASRNPNNSVLLKRMLRTVPADQGMPPISHRQMDKAAVELITRWINSIDEKGNPLPQR